MSCKSRKHFKPLRIWLPAEKEALCLYAPEASGLEELVGGMNEQAKLTRRPDYSLGSVRNQLNRLQRKYPDKIPVEISRKFEAEYCRIRRKEKRAKKKKGTRYTDEDKESMREFIMSHPKGGVTELARQMYRTEAGVVSILLTLSDQEPDKYPIEVVRVYNAEKERNLGKGKRKKILSQRKAQRKYIATHEEEEKQRKADWWEERGGEKTIQHRIEVIVEKTLRFMDIYGFDRTLHDYMLEFENEEITVPEYKERLLELGLSKDNVDGILRKTRWAGRKKAA